MTGPVVGGVGEVGAAGGAGGVFGGGVAWGDDGAGIYGFWPRLVANFAVVVQSQIHASPPLVFHEKSGIVVSLFPFPVLRLPDATAELPSQG
jgi:hypothetical protein